MIANTGSEFRSNDIAKYAWSGLKKFQNRVLTEAALIKLHSVPRKHFKNAEKQADQIRYCLIQAHEYQIAANAVSFTTKPLLIYYSIMNLALAEILFKQSGASSLDAARKQHAHHGLVLKPGDAARPAGDLTVSATKLRAEPHIQSGGGRFGTFELWHRSARETPICGDFYRDVALGRAVRGTSAIYAGHDLELPALPISGISLLDCYRALPSMYDFLGSQSIVPSCVRATAAVRQDTNSGDTRYSITIHPANRDAISAVIDKITFRPCDVPLINITEMPSGVIIDFLSTNQIGCNVGSLPIATQINSHDFWFLGPLEFLNEFGLFYVSLYILGNYVRYFPDRWMNDVENSSPLAMSAIALIEAAEERVALLTYSELSQNLFVIGV